MTEPLTRAASQDPLSEFIADQPSPLMAAPEWTALQALDVIRANFDGFLVNLNDEEKLEYVRLQGPGSRPSGRSSGPLPNSPEPLSGRQ